MKLLTKAEKIAYRGIRNAAAGGGGPNTIRSIFMHGYQHEILHGLDKAKSVLLHDGALGREIDHLGWKENFSRDCGFSDSHMHARIKTYTPNMSGV